MTSGIVSDQHSKDLRMKLYQSIKKKGEFSSTFMEPPPHWLSTNVFSINPQFNGKITIVNLNRYWWSC